MTAIKAHFDGKVLVPDEPVDLPLNQPLRVFVAPLPSQTETSEAPLLELAHALNQLPPNPASPTDGAEQHDHYLYGTPKRP